MTSELDPQIAMLLQKAAEAGLPKIQDLSPQEARRQFNQNTARLRQLAPFVDIARVVTTSTGAGYGHVPVRIYDPAPDRRKPCLVYYHGGGHVLGGLDSHDGVARSLAKRAGILVVSADYRMAPEHVFPAAVNDSFDVLRSVHDTAEALGVDARAIAVGGDSAGGNLAAVVALMARDAGALPLAAQVLVYPVIDYRGGTASYARFGAGYGPLEGDTVAWFRDHYLPDASARDDWRAVPINAKLHDLPATLLILAECDVLVDEGRAFGQKLSAAGVPVQEHVFPGMIHAFYNYVGFVDEATRAHDVTAAFLRSVLPDTVVFSD